MRVRSGNPGGQEDDFHVLAQVQELNDFFIQLTQPEMISGTDEHYEKMHKETTSRRQGRAGGRGRSPPARLQDCCASKHTG